MINDPPSRDYHNEIRAERDKLLADNAILSKWHLDAEARTEAAERKLQQRADELNVLRGSIAAYQTGELERKLAMAVEALRKLAKASARLSVAAQTTGGVAGRDEGLCAEIDRLAQPLGEARATLAEMEKNDE